MGDVAVALADDHPFALMSLVSSLLAALEPRRASPFEQPPDPDVPTLDELVRTFLDVDLVETSALLTVIAELSADDIMRRRIRREITQRAHALPEWLTELGKTTVAGVVEMVHVLGDGDNIMIGLDLPGDCALSVVVYIDHNMGTLVKDAFAVPEPLDALIETMRDVGDDQDTTWTDLTPADARARIRDAVEQGAITFPPFETDSWPACRPLVEWAVDMLPAGGTGYQRPHYDANALGELTERFLASPFGGGLNDADHRGLLESVLWFGTDYGPGDPLRWSPVAVEILLIDWIPRKIVADADYLSKVPDLLRAFVRFCHHERGIRAALTADTLAAVDKHEPEYQLTIRSARPQGRPRCWPRWGHSIPKGRGRFPKPSYQASRRPCSIPSAAPSAAVNHWTTSIRRRYPTSLSAGTPFPPTSTTGWPKYFGWSTGAVTSYSMSSTARPAAATSVAPRRPIRRSSGAAAGPRPPRRQSAGALGRPMTCSLLRCWSRT